MVFPGPVFDILCSHLGPDVPVLLALQAGLDKFQPLDAVIDIGVGPVVMINPRIVESSGEQTGEEGCLSVPGKSGIVTRPNYVKAVALDEDMKEYEIEGEGLMARAICHELEHLDGHLYVEKVEGELHSTEYEEA